LTGLSATLCSLRNNDWTRILGWPGYRVYRSEINEEAKALRLWVRRKSGERKLVCCGCGRSVSEIAEVCEREIHDLPCFEYRTTVVVELYRVRCPDCGVKTEKVAQLPSKAPFSKRFEDAVGEACESAAAHAGWPSRWGWRRAQCDLSTCVIWKAGRRKSAGATGRK